MKTNLLKLKRKHPFLFELFYRNELNRRILARKFEKSSSIAIAILKVKADECWGWDIDREAYDACIIALHTIEQLKNEFKDELN